MSERTPLGAPPRITIDVVADDTATARCDRGFLKLRRLTLRSRHEGGHESRPYRYDLVERDALDAVAIVLSVRVDGEPGVCLRSALRPPLAFRGGYSVPIAETVARAVLWEVPAGLVEPDERGEEGLRECAARETLEETGLGPPASSFTRLGGPCFLSPGVMAEQIHFFVAEVDPATRGTPTEDGSPVEERAEVRFVTLREALAAVRDGRIEDLKTETAIRRLCDREGVR